MSCVGSTRKSVRFSPRHNSRPSPSMGVPNRRRKRRGTEVDRTTVVGERKSLRLKLIDLKNVGDIINVEYGNREKLALNSKYTVTEVLKTLALKDAYHSRSVHNSQKPPTSEERENKPTPVTKVMQESPKSVILQERAQSVVRDKAVKSQRLVHRICKMCKVGFVNSELLALHKCSKRVEPDQDVQISVESETADPQVDTEKLSNSDTIEARSKELHGTRSLPEEQISRRTTQQSDLPAHCVSHAVETQKKVPQKMSKSHRKDPKKLFSQIEWLPEPMTVSVGYDAGSCICMTCGSKTHSLQALLLHFLPTRTLWKCSTCDARFTSNCERFVHNLENHQYLCPFCKAKFQTRDAAVTHTYLVHGEKYARMVRSYNFTRDDQPPVDLKKLPVPPLMIQVPLLGEVKPCKRNQARRVVCGKITLEEGFSFKDLLELKSKYVTSESMVSKPIKCLLCTQRLESYEILEEHVVKFHTFDSYEDLKRNLDETVEKVEESVFIPIEGNNSKSVVPFCSECNKVFQDIRALRRHNLSVHSVSTAYRLALSQKLAKSKNLDLPAGSEGPIGKERGLLQKEESILKVSKEAVSSAHMSNHLTSCKKLCANDPHQIEKGNEEEEHLIDVEKIDSEDEHQRSELLKRSNKKTIIKEKGGGEETSRNIVPVSEVDNPQSTTSTSNNSISASNETAKTKTTQVTSVEDGIDPIKLQTKPSVVKSRQCPSKDASWYLPDALFSMSAHRVTTKAQVREVDSLINRTLDELDIGKTGSSGHLMNRPSLNYIGSSVAAYMKLRPVLDNPPRTPTARRNYEPNPKYRFPMGHFNPEFEEMPLFPTLSDVFRRTNGYKHSPLQVMTAKEIKKTVAMDKSKESKRLRKHFAQALEDFFLLRTEQQVTSVARGNAGVQQCFNSQAHSYLSGRICGHIKKRLSVMVDKQQIPPCQPAHHQQVLLSSLTGLPPLMGPMTVAGMRPQTNCLQQEPVGVAPQTTSTHPSQANLRRTLPVAGKSFVTLNGKTVNVASPAASPHLLQTNLYKTMPAASKSFLALNGTGIATIVNIQSQPLIQNMEHRILPSSRSSGSGMDELTDPQRAAHITMPVNEPSSANSKYPPTLLRVPISALQHIGSQHSAIPSPSSGNVQPAQNHIGHVSMPQQSSAPPLMAIKVSQVQSGTRQVDKPHSAVHSLAAVRILPGSNGITHVCASQSSLTSASGSTCTQHESIPPLLSATSVLNQQRGAVIPTSLAVESSLNLQQGSVKPFSVSTSRSLYTQGYSVTPFPSLSVSNPHPNSTTCVKSSHAGEHHVRPSIYLQGQTSTSLSKIALPPLTPILPFINQTVSQPLGQSTFITLQNKPSDIGRSMTQMVGGSRLAPPPLRHSSGLFRSSLGLSSSQTTRQPENKRKQKHAIRRSPQDVIRVVGKSLTLTAADVGPKTSRHSRHRHSSPRTGDLSRRTKTTNVETSNGEGTLTLQRRKLLSMEHSYSIQGSSNFRPNRNYKPSSGGKHQKKKKKHLHPLKKCEVLQKYWFFRQQARRRKHEARLKRSLLMRSPETLEYFIPTKSIRRKTISAVEVFCKGTDAEHVQLVSESVKRGRSASVRLDSFNDLIKQYSSGTS